MRKESLTYHMLKYVTFILASTVLLLSLYGCGGKEKVKYSPGESVTAGIYAGDSEGKIQALNYHFRSWKGTKYRMGGLSRSGVDCSGFTQLTYNSLFNISLPRTTEKQLKKGRLVSKQSLRPGDLVFFKTGIRQKHVGIYYDDGMFIHASLSKGVVMSRLDNRYWKKHYYKAKRL